MKKKWLILIVVTLVCLLMMACGTAAADDDESMAQSNPPGGLPTPFAGYLGDYQNNNYVYETVDYGALSPEAYRIRSSVEFVGIYEYMISQDRDIEDIVEADVQKYGIKNYWSCDDLILFRTFEDMKMVLHNTDFQNDLENEFGWRFEPSAYYLPAYLKGDYTASYFLPYEDKYHFEQYGYEYTEDEDFFANVWAVFDVQDSPGADEIAQYYAGLNNLRVENTAGETGTVYYFTAENGCALIEKFGVETYDTATAYIWEQDGVIGMVILPGEHKDENLDLCVLERYEL